MTPSASGTQVPDRAGDAFERLFVAEYPRVVGIANRVLANPHEAEEVAQDVFISFNRRHSPEAPYARPWLHSAASHAALNRLRDNRRRERRELRNAALEAEVVGDPGQEVERAEDRQRVRAAMRRLPPKSASVLSLRYAGLSYAEVAAALGVGVGQVGTLLRRAEARLKAEVYR
ncbi:MAG TPA: sigma-70 family RNA polymerase sigma factor [Candidatus Dormibacteraeota bacterium]|nr:sigma-70 family RNA polymerase sigma factor [Candidatus Dormibacteraeota bacterium]